MNTGEYSKEKCKLDPSIWEGIVLKLFFHAHLSVIIIEITHLLFIFYKNFTKKWCLEPCFTEPKFCYLKFNWFPFHFKGKAPGHQTSILWHCRCWAADVKCTARLDLFLYLSPCLYAFCNFWIIVPITAPFSSFYCIKLSSEKKFKRFCTRCLYCVSVLSFSCFLG